MLFIEEDCLLMDLSTSGESSEDQVIPGAVDLPHDFSLVSQHIDLTPIPSTMPDLTEQDLFFISDADSVSSSSPYLIHDDPFVEGPRKKLKRDDVYVSPVSVCTITHPFHVVLPHETPSPPLPLFSNEEFSDPDTDTSRFSIQLAILSQRMRQSEESRQKVSQHRKRLAHVYGSIKSPETSLFTTSKIASAYHESRLALLSSLCQAMEGSPTFAMSPS